MFILTDVRKAVTDNIQRLMKSGAQYCDGRWYQDDSSENFVILDGNLEANDTTVESGLGVRVLYGGAWGFAATSRLGNIGSCFIICFSRYPKYIGKVIVKIASFHFLTLFFRLFHEIVLYC